MTWRHGFLLALCLAGCRRPAPAPAPAPVPRPDGAIESLRPLFRTERSEYFALTYWSDGLRVEGFLGRPRSGAPHPAVVFNRAGHLNLASLRGPEIVPLVEAGFVTAASQYRGNAGSEGREEFGGADVDDVLNLVPLLKSLPEVDPERIGMLGWSRGGTMTYLALRQETRRGAHDIKVGVAIGATADFTEGAWERLQMLAVFAEQVGKRKESHVDPSRERSAVAWPELINAPLLIEHGEADALASVEKARLLASLLEKAGKTVKLVTYPGDDHALDAHENGYPEALEWLAKYIGRPGEDHAFAPHREEIFRVFRAWPR